MVVFGGGHGTTKPAPAPLPPPAKGAHIDDSAAVTYEQGSTDTALTW